MITENKIRHHVRMLLREDEQTKRPGRGGYKKEIQAAGALAKQNPRELMKRLGVRKATGEEDIERVNSVLQQAVAGSDSTSAMKNVFAEPQPRKDKATGYKGIRLPVQVIPARDARKYIEHTLVAAQAARMAVFDSEIQIEILGNDVLIYLSPKPYSWGRPKGAGKPKKKEEAIEEREVLGEPDINPDRDSEDSDEASGSAAVSGPITPLGTGPTYPDTPRKKPKSPAEITGRAFGGAKPVKKKN